MINQLRRIVGIALAVICALGLNCATARADGAPSLPDYPLAVNEVQVDGIPMVADKAPGAPQIVSPAAVVIDMATGVVVYAKNPLAPHYPASITKIMTALIALQHGHLDDALTVSPLAAGQPADNLGLVPGEVESLDKLLYALLLYSANDAAVVIAERYGGSVAGFANMMNSEARQLGAVHTHFVNPNGLPDPGHVTTAYDMALISRAAMQDPEFRRIVATRYYDWEGDARSFRLYNLNRMLVSYPGTIGIKTGYTSQAHDTLAVAATRSGRTFIAILMDAPTNWQIRADAAHLLNFAFANYATQTLVPAGQAVTDVKTPDGRTLPVYTAKGVVATVRVGRPLMFTTRTRIARVPEHWGSGTSVGTLDVLSHGQILASVPLVLPGADPLDSARAPRLPARHDGALMWELPVGGAVAVYLAGGIWRRRRRWAAMRRTYPHG